MKRMGTWVAAACIVSSVLLSGCDDGSGSGGGSTGSSGPKVLNVKGLYLGMDITEAHVVCTKLLEKSPYGGVNSINDGGEDSISLRLIKMEIGLKEIGKYFGGLGVGVAADKTGKVNGYFFEGVVVNNIFGADDMEDSGFVQAFANSYQIPVFKVADDLMYWYFDSPHGYRIVIKEKKKLIVKKVEHAKFD